jgi:DNA-binding PadR family transcriptional regulator
MNQYTVCILEALVSVRLGLLAILAQGDCYGYQLRGEFERRTGVVDSLNVGQTYATLDRLERDGLVERGVANTEGHVFYRITDAGRAVASGWLMTADSAVRTTRDELAAKIAIAATLPGIDVVEVVAAERAAAADRVDRATISASALDAFEAHGDEGLRPPGERIAARIVADARRFRAEAELAWLDHVATMLDAAGPDTARLPLETDTPRRGRPANRTTASMP